MNIQTLLVLGALMLIGTISLMVNRHLLSSSERVTEANAIMTALSVGEAVVSEAINQRFDENANANALTQFTASSALGPDSGEEYPNFDDVDDYNELDTYTTINTMQFHVTAKVTYVSATDLVTKQTSTQYNKRLVVSVSSPYLFSVRDNAVSLDYIFTYQRLFN